MPSTAVSGLDAPVSTAKESYRAALGVLGSIFFIWGFVTVINNALLPHLRSVFDLDYTRTTLIQSVWFAAYLFTSVPSAKLILRIGYKRSLVVGLAMMALGALMMVPASLIPSYWMVLIALFVIASGITVLQVTANPYVALVGPPETAPSRLNFVQAFNALGTTLAPLFGGYLILGRSTSGTVEAGRVLTEAERLADAQTIQFPYLLVAAVLVLLAIVIALFRLPDINAEKRHSSETEKRQHSLWRHRNLVFGIPAILIYMIAEIGVSSLFINFVSLPEIGNMTHADALDFLFLLWGGLMVGRFGGSYLMRIWRAETVLAWFSIGAFVLMMITVFASGPVAMWSLILVGLFHSIMFPTIFTLGIRGLGPLAAEGSGLLNMAIAGGALVVVQGWFADLYGLQLSFLLIAACELYVLFYALWGSRPTEIIPQGKGMLADPPT